MDNGIVVDKRYVTRKLDRIEKLFARTGNYPCDIAEYCGKLDENALVNAYSMLRLRYPALGARIIVERAECDFDPTRPTDEQVAFVEGDELTLRHAIRDVRNKDQDASRLIIARNSSGGLVALCVNHALFDFPSFGFLFNELWHLYAQLIAGLGTPDSLEAVLPRSPEQIITERWLGSPPIIPEQSLSVLRGRRSKRVTQRMIEFGVEETNEVIAAARSTNVSVHALVCSEICPACEITQSTLERGDVLSIGCQSAASRASDSGSSRDYSAAGLPRCRSRRSAECGSVRNRSRY